MANMLRVKEPFNVNRLAQVAALAALDDEEHVQPGPEVNRQGKAFLEKALTAMGVRMWPSQANFLWMDVGEESRRVFQELLASGHRAHGGHFRLSHLLAGDGGNPGTERAVFGSAAARLARIAGKSGV